MKPNVSLVLSAGGARGMAHIGIINVLEKQGFQISSIAGTSMGALVGGIHAVGQLNDFTLWLKNLGKMEVFKLTDFAMSKKGFIKGNKVFKELDPFITDANIEDLAINYTAIASNLTHLKEAVFETGKLKDAIRASVAIPVFIQPHHYLDCVMVDGGLVNPLPVDRVRRSPGDILIAVNVNSGIPFTKPPMKAQLIEKKSLYRTAIEKINHSWAEHLNNNNNHNHNNHKMGMYDLLSKSVEIMQVRLSEASVKNCKPDIMIDISYECCDIFEFYRAEEIITMGKKAMEKALIEWKGV